MAADQVVADVGTLDVGIVDVIFKVYRDGELFGRLKVSQGAVEWQEAHVKKYVHSMEWGKLEGLFLNEGRRIRKPLVHGPLRKRHA
jgi:hypothetical protein